MQIVRYKKEDYQRFGRLQDGSITPFITGNDPYNCDLGDGCFDVNNQFNLKECELISPISPTKIIGVALNYPGVSGNLDSQKPLIFLKASNAIISSKSRVTLPRDLKAWGESELGVIIKQKIININASEVKDCILGYTIVNDITCHNTEGRDHHLARSKNQDGFCPTGDYIETNFSYKNKMIRAYQNDHLLREGNTNDMIFDVDIIIEYVSSFMTLYPGDLIITGAPPRVREKVYLAKDDTYRISIEGFEDIETKFL
ncbi:MAG: hypothetical protein HN564_07085 [Flavobacteriales bacterium]|jgi:2-keto-4-pentenoate hydratase/2-oxohepta-3-ene-1,7-dioic acid hydratase in catechol pathway|nr:hypothetical protein [Flavobacteriales bacterium]